MRSAKVCLKCGGSVRVVRSREASGPGVLRRRAYVCEDGHRYTTIEVEESNLKHSAVLERFILEANEATQRAVAGFKGEPLA